MHRSSVPRALVFDQEPMGDEDKPPVSRSPASSNQEVPQDEDTRGPLSPVLQEPGTRNDIDDQDHGGYSNRETGLAVDDDQSKEGEYQGVGEVRGLLKQSEAKLERRLKKMALLHATTTAQLVKMHEQQHQRELKACQEKNVISQMNLQNELVLKQAEVDALGKAWEEEVKSWAIRAKSCEAREATLLVERAALAAEVRRLRFVIGEKEQNVTAEVAKATVRGQEQVDQLGRLFLMHGAIW